MKIISIISLTLLLFGCATAQPIGMSYSTKSKKAIKLFELGQQAPGQSIDPKTGGANYRKGLEYMNQAIAKDPNFWEAHLFAGEFCEYLRKPEEAINHYQKALKINPNHAPTGNTHFFLAGLQFETGKYSDALKTIEILEKKTAVSDQMMAGARMIKQNSLFAVDQMKNPKDFNPINIGGGINTKYPEYFPTITVDGKTILFTRLIPTQNPSAGFEKQEDFFISHLENKVWQTAYPMPKNVNTPNNEGAPTISADGKSLIFVACPDITGRDYGAGRKGRGSCDLFVTKKLGRKWTTPKNLPGYVNSGHWETQPSLSADGKTLYFIRGIRGRGQTNNSDIYVSKKDENGIWGRPTRLPDYINTPQKEESVLIHPDGKTLYFASRGHIGMGGSDLFVCRMQPDGMWSRPENLGYPINTQYDENSLMVSPDGEIGFFASNREGGFGDLDIYYFEMPENLRPTKTLYFEGMVFDVVTKRPVPGKFQLIDLETGKEVVYSEADKIDGSFMVSLPVNREYALNVSYPGYNFFSKNFDMTNPEGQEAVKMDVPMVPINNSQPVTLENVFFDLSKATLRPTSFVELDKLVAFLNENGSVKIELSGHTDTRGNAEKNKVLSENRAKSVYEYLISKGVDASRLSYKGYGASKPKISDEKIAQLSTEKEREAAHQKNRRTEYSIVK